MSIFDINDGNYRTFEISCTKTFNCIEDEDMETFF